MIRHNLLLALRNFRRSSGEFLINLAGLSAGLVSCIFIYLWISDELSVDDFHHLNSRMYQVMEHQKQQDGWRTHGNSDGGLASELMNQIPEIESAVAVTPNNFFPAFTLSTAGQAVKANGRFADRQFFEIFSFELIEGSAHQALNEKSGIAISSSLSDKLFGSGTSGLGKTFSWDVMNIRKEVIVTGVFRDVPDNSSLQFDFVLPFDSFRDIMGMDVTNVNWNNPGPFETYVLLSNESNTRSVETGMNKLLKVRADNAADRKLFLKPFHDKYLRGKYENGVQAGGRIEYVLILSIVGGLILLIACINFVNLYTAKALSRVKQVGIKKAMGARRSTLVVQYLTESSVMVVIATLLSLGLVAVLLPLFNEFTGKHISLSFDAPVALVLVAISAGASLLAGGYPAFYLSGFDAAKTMKGETISFKDRGILRKTLSVFQFTLSMMFVVGVIVTNEQLKFIQTRNLGYDRDHVLYFPAEGKLIQNIQGFLAEAKKVNGVSLVTSMLANVIDPNDGEGWPLTIDGRTFMLHHVTVNYGWTEVLDIEFVAGRKFSQEFTTDTDKVICNESAVRTLGIVNPIGQKIGGKEIIGVMRDFHFQSLHQAIEPLVIHLEPEAVTTIMARIEAGRERDAIVGLEVLYSAANPGFVFDYHFLNENFEAQYKAESQVRALTETAAIVAVIITCLGLFGLSTFLIERRGKEVSIRKILGSGSFNILLLLSADYFRIMIIAMSVSVPISIYLAQRWLSAYAFRIELGLWHFVIGPIAIVIVTVATLAIQTVKAATANPVSRLRAE